MPYNSLGILNDIQFGCRFHSPVLREQSTSYVKMNIETKSKYSVVMERVVMEQWESGATGIEKDREQG